MVSRRKLKGQIGRTKDPVVKMQLQMLLNEGRRRQGKKIKKVEGALDSLLRQAIGRLPDRAPHVLIAILGIIILFVIFMTLECRA
jgi:hypothetical protein